MARRKFKQILSLSNICRDKQVPSHISDNISISSFSGFRYVGKGTLPCF